MKFDFEILKKASSEQKLKVSEFEIQFKLTLPPMYYISLDQSPIVLSSI